jgi:hypothetical protein
VGASAVAAAIAARERHIVERFREAHATSPATARGAQEIDVDEGIAFKRLRRHEVIREATPQRFYLDEDVWIAVGRTRRRFLLAIVVLMLIVAAGTALGVISTR